MHNEIAVRAAKRAAPFLFILAVTVVSGGCSTMAPAPLPVTSTPISPENYDAFAGSIENWTLQGRLAVNRDGQGWNASLRWAQQLDAYHIDLSGPFGQGAAELQGNGQHMRAQLAGEEFVREGDPAQLMNQAVGWDVPVTSLRYWVLGLADPSQPAVRRWDPYGRPVALEQMGWVIEYTRHREDAVAPLPTRLTATRGEWRFKLIVDEWVDRVSEDPISRTHAQ